MDHETETRLGGLVRDRDDGIIAAFVVDKVIGALDQGGHVAGQFAQHLLAAGVQAVGHLEGGGHLLGSVCLRC